MARIVANLSVRMPWWAGAYILACRVWFCFGLPLDFDRVAKRIMDHTKIRLT